MLHGTEPYVFIILHGIDFRKITLLMAIEDIINVNQSNIVVFVRNIQFSNIPVKKSSPHYSTTVGNTSAPLAKMARN